MNKPTIVAASKEPPRLGAPGSRSERNHAQETPAAEREFHEEGGAPRPTPESVGYHDGNEMCQACEYFSGEGACSFLQMQVDPAGHCNRFEGKAEDAIAEHDAGGMEMEGE